ncbi:unnamed protein product [Camellia sinensis]
MNFSNNHAMFFVVVVGLSDCCSLRLCGGADPTDGFTNEPTSHTEPRTEVRIRGLDYSSGVWQFEGYGFVPNPTSSATIVQIHIHGASHGATTIILRIYNGDMRYYSGEPVDTDLYDKWFRVN